MSESQNGRSASFVDGLAIILASACCLRSSVLITLGFSGTWVGSLTVPEPYRPTFIGAALVALFFAWRRIYHPVQTCRPGEVCATPQVRTTCKLIPWVVAVLILVVLGFSYVIPLFHWLEFTIKKLFASLALAAVVAPVWVATQPITLSIPGMTYSAYPIIVKKAISEADGVNKTAVTFRAREAVVTFDDAKTSVQRLAKATRDADCPSNVKQWATESDPGAITGLATRIIDKAGVFSSVASVMGCAICFPTTVSLSAAIGLGFLQEYEGLFIFTLLPLFAVVASLANTLGWLSHR